MPRKDAKNNAFLKGVREKTSPQVYSLILGLVNEDRMELGELVLKVDYLLEYANVCVKQKSYREAGETLDKAKARIDYLKNEGVDTDFLEYISEGIEKKIKR